MAKIAQFLFAALLRYLLLNVMTCTPLLATILTTNLSGLALEITIGVRTYAKDHDGTTPKSWDDLRGYLDFDDMDHRYKMAVRSAMMMLQDVHPTLEGASPEKLVAMTAFAINEDRREEIGRYVIVHCGDGTFAHRWANESAILKACAAVNLTLLPTTVFQEVPLRVSSLKYASGLVEDAVKHGVSPEEAEKAVKKHVFEVKNRRARYATTWAEIAMADLPSEGPPPVSLTPPPAAQLTDDSSNWHWMGSGCALGIAAALAIYWKRFRVGEAR